LRSTATSPRRSENGLRKLIIVGNLSGASFIETKVF
jgi:hypothetical protein